MAADFDRRLGSVACQCFERVNSLEAGFKLVVSFQGLLDRPDIADDVGAQYPLMIDMYEHELDTVKALFDGQRTHAVLNKNMPQTAGALKVQSTDHAR